MNSLSKMKNLFVLVCLTFLTLPYLVMAEIVGCKVGDLDQGKWISLPVTEDCPFKGPHADDSPWPTDEPEVTYSPWAISGRYKIIEWMISNASYYAIPKKPNSNGYPFGCINGYEEAAAERYCEKMESETPLRTRICVANSNISTLTEIYHYPDNYIMPNYYRRFDAYVRTFQEWRCDNLSEPNPIIEKNIGAPCPPDQCCQNTET